MAMPTTHTAFQLSVSQYLIGHLYLSGKNTKQTHVTMRLDYVLKIETPF